MNRTWRVPLALVTVMGVGLIAQPTAMAADVTTTVTSSTGATASNAGQTPVPKAAISAQDATNTATKLLNIAADYHSTGAQLQSSWGAYSQPVYSIQWQGPSVPQPGAQGHRFAAFMNAIVDANTGTILSFSTNQPGSNWFDEPTINTTQAQQSAQNWLATLAPSVQGQMTLNPGSSNPGGQQFSFRFTRMVNGMPAPFDGAQVVIAPDGSLQSYQFSWHNVTFPDTKAKVSSDSLMTAYMSALGLHLAYVSQYGPYARNTILTYAPDPNVTGSNIGIYYTPGPWFDASTGAPLGPDGKPVTTSAQTTYTPIVAGGPTAFPTLRSQPLDAVGAEAVARTALNLGPNVKLNNTSQGTYSDGSVAGRQFSLSFSDDKTNAQFEVTVDAGLGIITNYNVPVRGGATATSSNTVTSAQAQQIATDFIKRLYPNLTSAIALAPNAVKAIQKGPNTVYPETFVLLIHGIPSTAYISVSVGNSGQVQDVNVQPSLFQTNYPSSANAITLEQAEAKYMEAAPLQLVYELPSTISATGNGAAAVQSSDKAILVYAPNWKEPFQQLDALGGAWVNTWTPSGTVPMDIQGHVGAEEMALLAEHGTLTLTDGKVNPDQVVTRGQFVSLLVKSSDSFYGGDTGNLTPFTDVSSSSPYYADIQQAIMQGWLPTGGTFHPDGILTRADAAQLLIRWMGWSKVATKPDMFATSFADASTIPSAEFGDAVIASTFGLIPSVSGSYLPNKSMTIADASIAIVHALRVLYDN